MEFYVIMQICRVNKKAYLYFPSAAYSVVQEQPGDSFYVRALFDNLASEASQELTFRKDDILYVDNTLYNSVPGLWRAWLLEQDGQKRSWGTIPSKDK